VLPAGTPVPRGSIIGYVTLTGCVQGSASPWAIPGYWHWQLADPVGLADPVAARGALGLWQLPPEPGTSPSRRKWSRATSTGLMRRGFTSPLGTSSGGQDGVAKPD